MFSESNALPLKMNYSSVYQEAQTPAVENSDTGTATTRDFSAFSSDQDQQQSQTEGLLPIPKKSRTIKTDKPRPFLCPICTRGFVRQEHLKRHQRSHTNEKPFLCIFCGRCFARRDLVLRHQHKLHASLVSRSSLGNISTSGSLDEISKLADKQSISNPEVADPDKHIIKIKGNKEAILPTPSNPMAKTAAQLKKAAREAAVIASSASNPIINNAIGATISSSSSLNSFTYGNSITPDEESKSSQSPVGSIIDNHTEINFPQRRKRHASFSASSAFTYVPDNESSQQIMRELEFMQDVPHQVGFSTPQFTAQQLMEKAVESGVLDVEILGLPPDFSLDDYHAHHNGSSAKEATHHDNGINDNKNGGSGIHSHDLINNTGNNISTSSLQNAPMTPGAYLLHNTPSLTNFLTMGSTGGGAGGFTGLTSHNSNLTSFKYQTSDSNDSTLETSPVKRPNAANGSTQKSIMDTTHTNHNTGVIAGRETVPNPEEDQWLSEFIFSSQLEPNFKVNFNNINDIGFADVFSNSSASVTPPIREIGSANSLSPGLGSTRLPSQNLMKRQVDGTNYSPTSNLSSASAHTNYSDQRRVSLSLGPAISSLFTSRQQDLFDKATESISMSTNSSPKTSPEFSSPDLRDASAQYRKGTKLTIFNEEFRHAIIEDSNLKSELFPTVDELNTYVNLYQYEFHRYFAFIHLHSIVPTIDNYPLILSITMIGALYGFHSSHAMLLSNICWHQIREYLNRTKNNYESTPLWLVQSIVLLTFIGIFSNDLNVTKGMNAQIMTLVKLVKATKLNLPLESLQTPPIESDHILEHQDNPDVLAKIRARYNTPEQIERSFHYFITAQARIRTCHAILLISNLFTSLVGLECSFHSIDLKCGVPCFHEKLYACESATQWAKNLSKYHIVLDSKFSLIQLSNGYEDYEHCLMYISTGSQYYFENSKISFKTLLSMLISIHEKIFLERKTMKYDSNAQMNEMKWRMNSKPVIDSMLKYWEALYIKSGGILTRNNENIPIINENPAMRLIIPLHLFANIRKCLDLRPAMNRIWLKNWDGMNKTLDNLCFDWDSLREASDYALNVIDFWVETVCIMKNAESTAIRTPVFSITCIFSSILIVAEHIKRVESWAQEFDPANPMAPVINASDRLLWLKSEKVLKKVEQHLLPKGYNMQSYSEFLRLQAKGALDVDVLDDALAQRAMNPDTPIKDTIAVIIKARLSSRCLYLGVRILGDAPIWPIALLFAHALQSRAIYNVKKRMQTISP